MLIPNGRPGTLAANPMLPRPGHAEPAPAAPATVEDLLRRISDAFPTLSPQLRTIARYVERQLEGLAMERIEDVALQCKVQPSAVVRFAKRLGFHGFNGLKRFLREAQRNACSPGRQLQDQWRRGLARADPDFDRDETAQAYLQQAADALDRLQGELSLGTLDEAVGALLAARSLWVVGTGADFPVATYLAHAFRQGDVPLHFIDGLGGMPAGQLHAIGPGDVMIAVDFAPYTDETRTIAQRAHARAAHVIALTDSLTSPLLGAAHTRLLASTFNWAGATSIVNRMVVAEALFVAYANRQHATPSAGATAARYAS